VTANQAAAVTAAVRQYFLTPSVTVESINWASIFLALEKQGLRKTNLDVLLISGLF
jgi:hypothetical protein